MAYKRAIFSLIIFLQACCSLGERGNDSDKVSVSRLVFGMACIVYEESREKKKEEQARKENAERNLPF